MDAVKDFVIESSSFLAKYREEKNKNADKAKIVNNLSVSMETIEQGLGGGDDDAIITEIKQRVREKTEEMKHALENQSLMYNVILETETQCKNMMKELLTLYNEIQNLKVSGTEVDKDDGAIGVEVANVLYSKCCANYQLRGDPSIQGVITNDEKGRMMRLDNWPMGLSNLDVYSKDIDNTTMHNIADLKLVFNTPWKDDKTA